MKLHKILVAWLLVLTMTSITFAQVGAQQQKNYGGTLVAHMLEEGVSLMQNYDLTDFYPAWTIFNKLVTYNVINYEVTPDIAQSWDISPDGLVYTFNLAKNVKFHDAVPMTSADVKFTFESVINEKGFWADRFTNLDRIETPDDYTVKFILKSPDATFLGNSLASYYAPMIIPKHLYEGTDVRTNPYNRKPIATGPYRFVEWVEGSHITLVRNEEYFKGRPYLDKVIIKFSPTWTPIISAIESGDVQFTYMNPPYSESVRLSKLPGIALTDYVQPLILHLDFNLKRTPFDNIKVRQAVASAIDLQDINNKAYAGLNKPLQGMYLSSVQWAYNPNALQPSYDPARAEQLLDEAGVKKGSDGIRFKTHCISIGEMGTDETCTVIKENLSKVGIDVKLEPVEWGTYVERVIKNRDFEMALGGGLVGPEPSALEFFVTTGAYRNTMSYSNARFDELFA